MFFVSSWQILLYDWLERVGRANAWFARVPVSVVVRNLLTTQREMPTACSGNNLESSIWRSWEISHFVDSEPYIMAKKATERNVKDKSWKPAQRVWARNNPTCNCTGAAVAGTESCGGRTSRKSRMVLQNLYGLNWWMAKALKTAGVASLSTASDLQSIARAGKRQGFASSRPPRSWKSCVLGRTVERSIYKRGEGEIALSDAIRCVVGGGNTMSGSPGLLHRCHRDPIIAAVSRIYRV